MLHVHVYLICINSNNSGRKADFQLHHSPPLDEVKESTTTGDDPLTVLQLCCALFTYFLFRQNPNPQHFFPRVSHVLVLISYALPPPCCNSNHEHHPHQEAQDAQ